MQDGSRGLPADGRPLSGMLFCLCAILFCGNVLRAQTGTRPPAAGEAPAIRIKKPLHDFGTVPAGQLVEHEFVISNIGGAPLEILRVRTTCGCTAGNVEPAKIPPGGTGALRVRFSTKGRRGKQRKAIYLITNDPTKKQIVCTLRGTLTQVAPSAKRPVVSPPSAADHARAKPPPLRPILPGSVGKIGPETRAEKPARWTRKKPHRD